MIAFSGVKPANSEDVLCEDVPFFIWHDINNIFRVKSKEEFVQAFSQVKLIRENLIPIVQQSMDCNSQEYADELHAFHNLGKIFTDFGNEIEEKGFYNTISNTVPKLIHAYLETGKSYTGKRITNPRMQFLRCFGNAFLIA